MNDWSSIIGEILSLKNDMSVLSPEALDVLYMSMKDLNYEYESIQEAMKKEKNRINILMYTLKKLKNLEQENRR